MLARDFRVLRRAARRTWAELARRDPTDVFRLSENLASALFVHELLLERPIWREALWMEVRPFAAWKERERVDLWLRWPAVNPPIAIELKLGGPGADGAHGVRGSLISDIYKLASALRHANGGRACLIYFGRVDNLDAKGRLCEVSKKPAGHCSLIPGPKLPASATERRFSHVDAWYKPEHDTPKLIGIRLLTKVVKNGFGLWMWQISRP